MSTKQIVDSYFQAIGARDWDKLRALLHDDLRFQGPIDEFDRAEDLVASLRKLSKIAKGAEIHRFFVDGDDACVVFDLLTDTPIGPTPIAEWFSLRDGKIASIRIHFDARPFAAMFGQA